MKKVKALNLCEIFGVKEGEEFEFVTSEGKRYRCGYLHKIENNVLFSKYSGDEETEADEEWEEDDGLHLNILNEGNYIATFKQFTDDELCILKNINKVYKWICKDEDGVLSIYVDKPKKYKDGAYWDDNNSCILDIEQIIPHLFQSIQWQDEEPVFIDDYVERKVR